MIFISLVLRNSVSNEEQPLGKELVKYGAKCLLNCILVVVLEGEVADGV